MTSSTSSPTPSPSPSENDPLGLTEEQRILSNINRTYEQLIPKGRDYLLVRPENAGAARSLLGPGGPNLIVSDLLPQGAAWLYSPPPDEPLSIEHWLDRD